MPVYRHSGGTVIRSHLRVRVGGSTLGAGRRIRTPIADPPPVVTGSMTYTAEPLGGGGWVTGMAVSPDGLTRLARTDTLGGWRWDSVADKWQATVTATSIPAPDSDMDSGQGVQAVGAANSVAFMGYKSSIYKSTDKGATWAVSLASGPTTAPNAGDQRWWNTRMAFDPATDNTCLYGTIAGGLYYTKNKGTAWTQVSSGSVPFGQSGWGIPCVAVDGSGNWYAAPFGNGVYCSTDAGSTWAKISSDAQFVAVSGMAAAPNGDIIVTASTDTTVSGTVARVFRYRSGAWSNITPPEVRKWRTVACDPLTPGRVLVQGDGGYTALSPDYGSTWPNYPLARTMGSDGDVPWLAATVTGASSTTFITLGSLIFDPVVAGRVWQSQGVGVWYADLPGTPGSITWQAQTRGLEQLVVNDVMAPPGGPAMVVCWDRSVFLVGETQAAPATTVPAPGNTPIHTAASLTSTLTQGYPTPITYAWTVVSAPGGSTATPASPSAASTTFIPDVAGSYTLRLTASNSAGSSTTDVTLTAVAAITGLSLPGTTGNYISTPDAASLDVAGSLTLIVKVSATNWAPATRLCLIGKHGNTSKSYALFMDSTGLRVELATATSGATGYIGNSLVPLTFPSGSVNWIKYVYDATANTSILYTSPDGATWAIHKTLSTPASQMNGLPIANSTEPLTLGHSSSTNLGYLTGTVYRGQVYDAGTLVADFNAEPVTRTGTRTPATVTDSKGLVWTPQGTGWDWVS